MWFLRKKEDWERAAELQLRECTVQSYIAVNEELLAKSDAKRQKAPHSEGYSVQMNGSCPWEWCRSGLPLRWSSPVFG
jgi:hypothetical protein